MRKLFLALMSVIGIVSLASVVRSGIGSRQMQLVPIKEEGLSARSYVQNGLVNQWDGIENVAYGVHDDSATIWIDLIGGVPMRNMKFGDNFAIPTGCGATDNRPGYYPFYITGDFTLHGCLMNCPRAWYNWTEIGIGKGTGVENGIALSGRDGNVTYSVCYRSAYSGTVHTMVNTGTIAEEQYVIDIVFQYVTKTYLVYVNGIFKGSAVIPSGNWNLDGEDLSVGVGLFQNYNGVGNFKVYGCMLYNRMLSDEEITYNCELDLRRFGNDGFRGHYHCLRIYNRPLAEAEVKWNAEIDKVRFLCL